MVSRSRGSGKGGDEWFNSLLPLVFPVSYSWYGYLITKPQVLRTFLDSESVETFISDKVRTGPRV